MAVKDTGKSRGSGYKAVVTLPAEDAHQFAAALAELLWPPADAVGHFEADGGRWQVEAYFAKKPDRAALKRFLADRPEGAAAALTIERLPDADWVAESQARLAPVRAGRFVVHGAHDRKRVPRGRRVIEIEAAQAFGTAHHGSTRGCLLALDALAKVRRFHRVLDLGTGTGLLAIAAARAWRARVLAGDIDPVAVGIARDNALANGVGRYVKVVEAAGLTHPAIRTAAPFDLVMANILARPLIALAPRIVRACACNGVIVLSGFTRDQSPCVAAAYRAAGAMSARVLTVGDWVTFAMRLSPERRPCGRRRRGAPATP